MDENAYLSRSSIRWVHQHQTERIRTAPCNKDNHSYKIRDSGHLQGNMSLHRPWCHRTNEVWWERSGKLSWGHQHTSSSLMRLPLASSVNHGPWPSWISANGWYGDARKWCGVARDEGRCTDGEPSYSKIFVMIRTDDMEQKWKLESVSCRYCRWVWIYLASVATVQ